MKRRILCIGGPLALVLGVALGPANLHAYCALPSYFQLWEQAFPDLVIPVYIGIGTGTTVEYSGLSADEVERFVLETISRHNEVAVGPRLRFAGYTTKDVNYSPMVADPFKDRPLGITVDSFPCTTNKCSSADAVACMGPSGMMDPKVRVSLAPQCPAGTGFGVSNHHLDSGADTFTVLLHEIGHALGLGHADDTQAECPMGAIFGNNPNGNAGTMNSVLGAANGAYREWRRDDIDGLSALYPHRSTELVSWDDIVFPQAPLEPDLVPIIGAESIRTPSPSSVSVPGGSAYFAAVDTAHRVVLYEDSGAGFTGPEVVDPGSSGLTWGNPALALGVDTVFVLWASAEQPDSLQVARRWAVRDVQGMTWSYGQDGPNAGARRYGAAYATTDYFVAATTHNSSLDFPIVTTFDTSGNAIDEAELDFRVFDIGSGVCTGDLDLSTCLLPYSTESFSGPNLSYLEVRVDGGGTISIDPNPIESIVPARGKMALGYRSDSGIRGTAGQRRYALLTPDTVPTPAPLPLPLIDGHDWPVAIGASSFSGAPPRWFGLTRRPLVCGNAIVQGGEQCDDGNVINGDGCDASCAVEPPPGGTGGATSETGGSDDLGGSELGGDGCECRVHRRASPTALVLVPPALFHRRRRSARG